MDIKSLDQALLEIIEVKNKLSELDYSDESYDTLEEELHDLEDDFVENFGPYMEEALHLVHDEFCPDNDVLLPIAYLAHKYVKKGEKEDGSPIFTVAADEGVIVEVDDYPDKVSRLVVLPNPTRIVLTTDKSNAEEVWRAK